MRLLICLLAIGLIGCAEYSRSKPELPSVVIAPIADNDSEAHLARLKAVIRQDALTSYGAECGSISVPDDAFIPVEITGGGLTEMAVTFGRIDCGIGPTRFSGTGGELVQIWIGSGGPVRLLLEQQMHGFTPSGDRLITLQHGGFCAGGTGPDACRVLYQWNDKDRTLEVRERQLASTLSSLEPMTYDYEALIRRR
jgi:hypothetical protein